MSGRISSDSIWGSVLAVSLRPRLWAPAGRVLWHVVGAGRLSARRGSGRLSRSRYWEFRRETASGSAEPEGSALALGAMSRDELLGYLEWLKHAS